MRKLLLSAITVILSVQMYAQPNMEDYPNPEEIQIGSYVVPYGATSGDWLIIAPGPLTEILSSYNDGTSVDWEGVLSEIEALPQLGDVASLTNLLSNYIPTDSDYETAGPVLCCTDICLNLHTGEPFPCGWCYSYQCHLCECFNEWMDLIY